MSLTPLQPQPLFGKKGPKKPNFPDFKNIKAPTVKINGQSVEDLLAPETIKAVVEQFKPETDLPDLKAKLAEKLGQEQADLVFATLQGDNKAVMAKLQQMASRTENLLAAVRENLGDQVADQAEKHAGMLFGVLAQAAAMSGMLPMIVPAQLQQLAEQAKKGALEGIQKNKNEIEKKQIETAILKALVDKADATVAAVTSQIYGNTADAAPSDDPELEAALDLLSQKTGQPKAVIAQQMKLVADMIGADYAELIKASAEELGGDDQQ